MAKLIFYSNITNEGFDLTLNGSLTGTGPLDAEITFLEPVTYVTTYNPRKSSIVTDHRSFQRVLGWQ